MQHRQHIHLSPFMHISNTPCGRKTTTTRSPLGDIFYVKSLMASPYLLQNARKSPGSEATEMNGYLFAKREPYV